MNFFQPMPPPPPPPNQLTQLSNNNLNPDVVADTSSSSSSSSSLTSSIIILSIVISSAVILSVTIYVLLRFLSRRLHHTTSHDEVHPPRNNSRSTSPPSHPAERQVPPPLSGSDSLPLFKFGSVTGTLSGGDCAVCLSKFELDDQLRLLPLCCHAFHARCIDTWLSDRQTCPLCRSTVYPTDADVRDKMVLDEGSFRIEIGSVSRRRGLPDAGESDGGRRRSFPMGSFEYIVEEGFEIPVDSSNRREYLEKEVSPAGESLVGGGGSGRNWLKDYVERLSSFSFSSQATSFRASGRFFTGSSRRNDVVVPVDQDLESSRVVGEEISELFRWISGV